MITAGSLEDVSVDSLLSLRQDKCPYNWIKEAFLLSKPCTTRLTLPMRIWFYSLGFLTIKLVDWRRRLEWSFPRYTVNWIGILLLLPRTRLLLFTFLDYIHTLAGNGIQDG